MFCIEVSMDGREWHRSMKEPCGFKKAKNAWDSASRIWKDSGKPIRVTSYSTRYLCTYVRIIRIGGTRAVHKWGCYREVVNRCSSTS
jgi:hypothetical protein